MVFSNGKTIEDTTCGAAVACLGYNNERVKNAMIKQMDSFCYSNSLFYGHEIGEELAAELIGGTNGEMAKVYLMCSGTFYYSSSNLHVVSNMSQVLKPWSRP